MHATSSARALTTIARALTSQSARDPPSPPSKVLTLILFTLLHLNVRITAVLLEGYGVVVSGGWFQFVLVPETNTTSLSDLTL